MSAVTQPAAAGESDECVLPVAGGFVRIAFVGGSIVRIRVGASATWVDEDAAMLDGATPPAIVDGTQRRHDEGVTLDLVDRRVRLQAAPMSLVIGTGDRRAAVTGAADAFSIASERIVLRLEYGPDERVYGAGQGTHRNLDLRGEERRMWHEVRSGQHVCSSGIPLLLNTRGYGLFLNSSYPARFVIGEGCKAPAPPLAKHALLAPAPWAVGEPSGEERADRISVIVDHGQAEFYVLLGTSFAEQLALYRDLTGAATLLPRWALGFIHSRNRYRTQSELMAHMREFRRRSIPVDVAVIDWYWFRVFGDLEWDRDAWPDPERMVGELEELGIRLMQAQHPYIDRGSIHWDRFASEGFLVEFPQQSRSLTSHDAIYDYSHPEACALWWQLTRRLFDTGVRAYWVDQVQPEVHPVGSRHFLGSRERVHNIYALLMARCLSDGQRSHARDRVFTLSFAGYSGMQRYGVVTWSGDVDPSWQVLKEQVVVGQQMSLSGQPYWTTDGGGYVAYEFYNPELLVRWLQWGAFCPVFRAHSKRPQNEPWTYGPGWETLTRETIELRYRMLPYLYALCHECHRTGLPPVRPMVMAFGEDRQAVDAETQFMFGGSLLVAPILEEGGRSREVYLPAGRWTCWWTGRMFDGGTTLMAFAPLERIPLYALAGAIVPEGTSADNAEGVFAAPIRIHVFGGADGAFTCYDDDGWSTDYEQGVVLEWRFGYDDQAHRLTIDRVGRNVARRGPTRFELVVHHQSGPHRIRLNGSDVVAYPAPYPEEASWSFDDRQQLHVHLPDADRQDHWELNWASQRSEPMACRAPASHPLRPLNLSRPGSRVAWVDAFCLADDGREAASDHRGWQLEPPVGWAVTSGPTRLETGTRDLDAVRWTLAASGPDYVGASRVAVTLPSGRGQTASVLSAALTSECLVAWRIAGPLAYDASDLIEQPHPIERQIDLGASYAGAAGEAVSWRECTVLDCTGYVNLVGFLENAYGPIPSGDYPVRRRLAFATTFVFSPEEREALLELEGEDRFKVWLNGSLILATRERAYPPGVQSGIRLKTGWNRLLLKAAHDGAREWGGRRWGFYVRLRSRDGSIMADLRNASKARDAPCG